MLISKFSNNDVIKKIVDIEREHNIILPNQYKDFLCKYNGGYTPKTKFKIKKISSDIRGFYGVGNDKLSLNDIELEKWIDKGVLPIACDSFGNYIVIGFNNDSNGKIYFCDHEAGYKTDFIAEDLKAFFKYCKSEKIGEDSKKSIKEREEELIARGRGHVITDGLRKMWQAEIDKYRNMTQEEVKLD